MLIGIVGKANVGKSTFFKAATLADVLIANYPFATIKPNQGFAFVKVDCVDKDFNVQCNPRTGFCIDHKRFVPFEVIDVAGLVPGAHEGKGMGNQFLDDLRPADLLIHVVDISGSTNEKGEPVPSGTHDPIEDIRFLDFELNMWYFSAVQKGWDKFSKKIQQEKEDIVKALVRHLTSLKVNDDLVKEVLKVNNLNIDRPSEWSEKELFNLAVFLRKKTKPIVIAANKIDIPCAKENVERAKKEFPDSVIIPCSAESELALKEAAKNSLIDYIPGESSFSVKGQLNEKQKNALDFIKKEILDKWGSTGVQDVFNVSIFDVLKYIAVFPGGVSKLEDSHGNILPDCFLIPDNSTAFDFAARIHTDLAKKFIRAIDVKKKRTVGKDHVLKNRDVIEIISNA
jgi:ribosome-binding ATPase